MNQEQENAVMQFVETFDGYTVFDLGCRLTCTEADAWIGLLLAFGYEDRAANLLEAHSDSDDEGDSHYQG